MALHQSDVVAIQQLVDLLAGQREYILRGTGPLELFLGQCLVIQHKAVVLPHQTFDPVALPIGEGVERPSEGTMPQLLLHQKRQAVGLLAEVDRRTVKIDLRHVAGRSQVMIAHHSCRRIAPSRGMLPACRPLMAMPPGSDTLSSPVAELGTGNTLANPVDDTGSARWLDSSFWRQ